MRALIDTNVILDVVFNRREFYAASARVLALARQGQVEGYIAAHAVTTVFYLIQREQDVATARVAFADLLRIARVAAVDQRVIEQAIGLPYRDFEDAVTMMAAVEVEADYVVTRNPGDFPHGPLPAVTPTEFLTQAQSGARSHEPACTRFDCRG